jgi:hypothetical protein
LQQLHHGQQQAGPAAAFTVAADAVAPFTIKYNTIHYGGTSLGNLRVALACEPRWLIPYSLVSYPSYPLGDLRLSFAGAVGPGCTPMACALSRLVHTYLP